MATNEKTKDGSSINPSMLFDPFAIGPDHQQHSHSTSVIELEESGRIFCPKCLENVSLKNIDKVDEVLFDQYVKNLFEALDQHAETEQLRRIVLPSLEIILKKRSITIKSDHEFHNILRIIHKTMNNGGFKSNEFSSTVTIVSIIATKFINSNPMPLVSIWKVIEKMLDYAKQHLAQFRISTTTVLTNESAQFISGAASIVRTYFSIIKRFSFDRISDLIFPLGGEGSPLTYQRKYHHDCQMSCLKFMSDNLIPHCWADIAGIERSLARHERDMVSELFDAMAESFVASNRLKYNNFLQLLIEKDCIFVAHSIISKNLDAEFREHIRQFLKIFVLFHIELEFGTDENFIEYKGRLDIVETNHKNAIAFSFDDRFKKTIFYLLVNCLALKQKSRYFFKARMEKVLKVVVPTSIKVTKSKIFIKVYHYLIASTFKTFTRCENIGNHFIGRLRKMREKKDHLQFNEEFCFDEAVFFSAMKYSDFVRLVTVQSIRCLVEVSMKSGKLIDSLGNLLNNKSYRHLVIDYFKEDETSASAIEEIVKFDQTQHSYNNASDHKHEKLISNLSAMLPASFHSLVLNTINNTRASPSTEKKNPICKIVSMMIILLKNCKHFSIEFDDQSLKDISRMMSCLYELPDVRIREKTVMINDFFTQLMINNSPCLLRVLKHLEYFVLGHMYYRLANYERGDKVSESIARLLITYDKIDYPLRHNISKELYTMKASIINWMLSQCSELHILSLKLVKRLLIDDHRLSPSARVSIATSLILMVVANSKILEDRGHLEVFLSVLERDELRYNPLLKRISEYVSTPIKLAIVSKMQIFNDQPSSPSLSFSSVSSSPCSSFNFFGEGLSIINILNQLHDDEHTNRFDESCRIPNSLYISESVKNQHSSSFDPEEWERRAHETTKDLGE